MAARRDNVKMLLLPPVVYGPMDCGHVDKKRIKKCERGNRVMESETEGDKRHKIKYRDEEIERNKERPKVREDSRSKKVRLFNTNVKYVLLYGRETWKVTETVKRPLQIFISHCLRCILAI